MGTGGTPADHAVGSQEQRALCADSHRLLEATVGVRQITVGNDPVSLQGNSRRRQGMGRFRPTAAAGAGEQREAVFRQIMRGNGDTVPLQHDVRHARSRPAAGIVRVLEQRSGAAPLALVKMPSFAKAGFGGGTYKLTEAMSRGSRVPGSKKTNVPQGYELLTRTVTGYTGIKSFQAGAILNFGGLDKLVDQLGGIDMTVDEKVKSHHRKPDGSLRPLKPGGGDYTGPQAVYQPCQAAIKPLERLTICRHHGTTELEQRAAVALQVCTSSIATGNSAATPSAARTSAAQRAGERSWPAQLLRVPSLSNVANTARKPASPVIENLKNASSVGWFT